jgi:OTU domain-containing protein 3
MFRSVCDQMEGSPANHAKIRSDCVVFLKKFSENFAPFLETEDQSFAEYCAEMAQNGEWGGHAELQALSLGSVCVSCCFCLSLSLFRFTSEYCHSSA